jgi:hypothetical protein
MGPTEMIRDVLAISTGTEARLYGTTNYVEIESARAEWIGWIRGHDDLEPRWDTWMDCWAEYQESTK